MPSSVSPHTIPREKESESPPSTVKFNCSLSVSTQSLEVAEKEYVIELGSEGSEVLAELETGAGVEPLGAGVAVGVGVGVGVGVVVPEAHAPAVMITPSPQPESSGEVAVAEESTLSEPIAAYGVSFKS